MKDKVEGFRLSPQQARLWLQQRDSAAYRNLCVLSLEGSLREDVLRESFRRVVERHEMLRTTFHRRSGLKVPFQIIGDEAQLAWQLLDLSGASAPEREAETESLLAHEAAREVDYEKGPLLRLCLVRSAPTSHVLLVTLPALCADAHSFDNLIADAFKFYRAAVEPGGFASETEEPLQYVDFSEWQSEMLEGEDAAEGRDYWQQQDFTAHAAPAVPFEKSHFKETVFAPAMLASEIEPEAAAQLERAAQRYGATAADFLLACWQTLLWRLTGQAEIVVGVAAERKDYEGLREAIGLFARWLPVRTQFDAGFSFRELLRQIGQARREAGEWQEFFEWKQDAALSNGRGWEGGFFPVSFEFEAGTGALSGAGLDVKVVKHHVCFDRFKLKLRIHRRDEKLLAEFHYDAALFAPEAVRCFDEQFRALVSSAARNAEARLGELEPTGEAERERLLFEFNETRRDFAPRACVHELFEQQAASRATETALVYEDRRLSYAELNARANQLARYLQELGVRPETPVALYLERSEAVIVAMLGVMKAGGAYVPLEPAQPAERLRHMLEDVAAPVVLTEQRLLASLPPQGGRPVLLDSDWEEISRRSSANTTSGATGENLAYVIFTSGSTGRPKGVAVEHRQLFNYVRGVSERLELPRGGSYATVSTFSADLGHTMIFPALCLGGALHVISQERASDPVALADYFERHPVDCLKIVPSHFEALLAGPRPEELMPRRRLVLGGEASRREMVENLRKIAPGCEIHNHYGPTETTVGVITYKLRGEEGCVPAENIPLGRPLANTKIHLLDSARKPVPTGALGELHIGGAGLARGYFNRPDLTAEKFVPDPFSREPGARLYKSGDLARYWPAGDIEFAGRVDNQVKFHGFRVELDEIRNALNNHPQVRDSVVVVARDKHENDCLVAYYVSRQELEVGELRGFLQQSIIEETLPNVFVHLKKLPLTLNGKVNLRALPTLAEARQRQIHTYVAPRTPVEQEIAAICREILGIEQIGIRDNFFELGGHSLLATRVITQLRERFQVELPLRTLFEAPTVEGLALAITQLQAEEEDEDEMARLIAEIKLGSSEPLLGGAGD